MLARGDGGTPRLILCPGTAPEQAPAPRQMATAHHDHGQKPHHAPDQPAPKQLPCAFAILLDSPLAPPTPILALPSPPPFWRPAAPVAYAAIHRPLASPPPPATGPPPILSA
jgi:hypothetical protein